MDVRQVSQGGRPQPGRPGRLDRPSIHAVRGNQWRPLPVVDAAPRRTTGVRTVSFSADMVKELSAKLPASAVKSRSQAGRSVSYVEGWHVIAEANRIFGFDNWT